MYLPCMPHRWLLLLIWSLSLLGLQPSLHAQDQLPDTVPNRLLKAVESRNLAPVRALLAAGVNPNVPNSLHIPPLVSIASYWHNAPEEFEIVRLLLAAHADPNLADASGNTPLMQATLSDEERSNQAGIIELVRMLLAAGADIDRESASGATALSNATGIRKDRIARFLLDNRANLNKDGGEKFTPLHYAALAGDIDRVRTLLKAGAEANARDKEERTPLMLAAVSGSPDLVQTLLDAGADVNAEAQNHGNALGIAIETKNVETALLLARKGANPNARNRFGQPHLLEALNLSTETGKVVTHAEYIGYIRKLDNLIQALLDAGADPNLSKDSSGGPPLVAAIRRDEPMSRGEQVNWAPKLIAKGADVNLGHPLEAAIGHKYNEVVKLLLERNALIESDTQGETSHSLLLDAVIYDNTVAAKLLIEHGAKVDCFDTAHKTPLLWAAYKGQKELLELLLARGASLETKDVVGQTALMLAIKGDHPNIASLLRERGAKDTPDFRPSLNAHGQTVLRIPIKWLHGPVPPERLTYIQEMSKPEREWEAVPLLLLCQGQQRAALPIRFGALWQDPGLYDPHERNNIAYEVRRVLTGDSSIPAPDLNVSEDLYHFFGLLTLKGHTYVGIQFGIQKASFVFRLDVVDKTLELTLLARIPQIEHEPHVIPHSQTDLLLSRSDADALILTRMEGRFILDANDQWRKLPNPPDGSKPRP